MRVLSVNKNNFDKEVLNHKGLVLVDFNASWCGPCRMLKPVLEAVANEHDEYKIVAVDIDEESELAKEYGILSIPSFYYILIISLFLALVNSEC